MKRENNHITVARIGDNIFSLKATPWSQYRGSERQAKEPSLSIQAGGLKWRLVHYLNRYVACGMIYRA